MGRPYLVIFCDFPTHKDKIKYHTHKAEHHCTHQCWLESKGTKEGATSNLANSSTPSISDNTTVSGLTEPAMVNTTSSSSTDITALLANALSSLREGYAAISLNTLFEVLEALKSLF